MTGFDDELDAGGLEDAMGGLRRSVEAAVRVPPYELVVRRHQQRRRRRVGAGGLVLAALVAVGVTLAPGLVRPRTTGVSPTSQVTANTPRVASSGTLTLADVSFGDTQTGTLLGRRCTAACGDVVLSSSNGGQSYGSVVPIPGSHRDIAVGGALEIAYAPDLTVSTDAGADWTAIDAPAPVADVSVSSGQILVLLVPANAPAELWSGPMGAGSWASYTSLGSVPGSDDSARLLRTGATLVVVSNGGTPRAEVGTLTGGTPAWTPRQIAPCSPGSQASVSVVTRDDWWVACQGETTTNSDHHQGQEVAVTTDGGLSYTNVASVPNNSTTQQVTALGADIAYLSGGPSLLLTTNTGALWQQTGLPQAAPGIPHVPAGSGGKDVWVLSPGSATVWRTTGSGWKGVTVS